MRLFYLLLALSISAGWAAAEDWTTSDGISYKNVKVVRVEDDAITIIYKDGGALVPIHKLPTDLQQRFSYDPAKAKKAADARAKADTQNAKELQAEIDLANKMRHAQQVQDAQANTNTPGK